MKTISRLIEFYPNSPCAYTEIVYFANVAALVEWLKEMRDRGFPVRVMA